MRGAQVCRNAAVAFVLAALASAPATAGTTVASLRLDVPATPNRHAASMDVASYTLDTVADFSLVRLASNATRAAATRVTVMLPAVASGAMFATSGNGSRFPLLGLRQVSASGATLRRTIFYDVRVARFERPTSHDGNERRLTFTADRIEDMAGRPPG